MDMLYLDMFGKISPTSKGKSYILSIKDSFTRFTWLIPTVDMRAETIVEALKNNVFNTFGIPETLHSDNFQSYTGKLLEEVAERLEINTSTIPPMNYNSNLCERMHLDLGRFLRSVLEENNLEEWSDKLPEISFAINSSRAKLLGLSPFFLMFGRAPRIPIDLIYPNPNTQQQGPVKLSAAANYANKLIKTTKIAFEKVIEAWKVDIDNRSRSYTNNGKQNYKEVALVWLFNPVRRKGTSPKLISAWDGPYGIKKKFPTFYTK